MRIRPRGAQTTVATTAAADGTVALLEHPGNAAYRHSQSHAALAGQKDTAWAAYTKKRTTRLAKVLGKRVRDGYTLAGSIHTYLEQTVIRRPPEDQGLVSVGWALADKATDRGRLPRNRLVCNKQCKAKHSETK